MGAQRVAQGMGASAVPVVIVSRDRRERLLSTLARLAALPERPAVVVVDNGSRDGTADAVVLVEAAHREHRLAAQDGPAGDEPEHARPGQAGIATEWAARHELARRVGALLVADQHAAREDGDARRGVHGARGSRQRARRPPRVVVAQGHVGRVERPQRDVARARSAVAIERDDLDVAVARTHGLDRPVARAVVDHDDGRALRQRRQAREGRKQPLAAIATHDDDGDRGNAHVLSYPLRRAG